MNEESFTNVVTKSFGQNTKNSFGIGVIGIIIFIASMLVLWFNEGNYAKQNQIANYINKNAIPVESSYIDKNNDNKLISTFGIAITDEKLTDGILTIPNALVLERQVEMYQWEETEKTSTEKHMDGSSTETKGYDYNKVWNEFPIDSSEFHVTSYINPPFKIESERYNANKGKFGEFILSETQTSAFKNLEEYSNLPKKPNYILSENYYYNSKNINSPEIGDVRISYEYMPSNSPISVIGMQRSDKTITPMLTKQGKIYIQYDGILSQGEMLEKFNRDNLINTNIFRLVGFILMLIGLNLLLKPLTAILSFMPIVESFALFLTGSVVFLISIVLSLIIIALAWMYYRPLIAISILLVVVLLITQIKNKISTMKKF